MLIAERTWRKESSLHKINSLIYYILMVFEILIVIQLKLFESPNLIISVTLKT